MNPDPASPIIQIVQNSPASYQYWLPFLGSLVLAGVTVIGIWKSNATNRKAISAADSREWTKWRREKLTAHVEKFTALADEVAASLRGSITWNAQDTKRRLMEANNEQNPLLQIARNIELVADTKLNAELDAAIDALKRLEHTVEQHIEGHRREVAQGIAPGPELMKIKHAADEVDTRINEVLKRTRTVLESMGETT